VPAVDRALPRGWLVLAGFVLVAAVLHWAQAVFVPLALATLLAFLLNPLVTRVERWVGRTAAVLVVTVLAGAALGGATWRVTMELASVVTELPQYRTNIRQKIRDVRGASRGSSIETLQNTLKDIEAEINRDAPDQPEPVPVVAPEPSPLWGIPAMVASLSPVATAGLVVVLVIFMLLERRELRDRLLRLLGNAHVSVTLRALDEAGTRVSRYLLAQTMVNSCFGAGIGIGLYAIGVPHAALWGVLAAVLRFIPYVGPWIAAVAPIVVSFAALPGWERPIAVVGLFVVLELATNMLLEPIFYAGAAGTSEVGLIVAVAFWTWLWGPLGLLLATPLTVCIVVVAKHVPALEFLAILLSDSPGLEDGERFYQRLIAADTQEAHALLATAMEGGEAERVFDTMLVPALSVAKRAHLDGRLSAEEQDAVIDTAAAVLDELPAPERDEATAAALPGRILGYALGDAADALALRMLARLLDGSVERFEIVPDVSNRQSLLDHLHRSPVRALCIAGITPSRSAMLLHLVGRLRAAMPDLKIVVSRLGPFRPSADETRMVQQAGADAVARSLHETKARLLDALEPASERAAI
jgi:predicted PurR-regulated permease PerM